MFKIGDYVDHFNYGKGEIVTIDKKRESMEVFFDNKYDLLINEIIDERYYFENRTRLETTNCIRVFADELKLLGRKTDYKAHCHGCKSIISSQTHYYCEECGWLKCECGSCKCNYRAEKN